MDRPRLIENQVLRTAGHGAVTRSLSDLTRKEMRQIAQSLVTKSMRIGRRADGEYEGVRILYNFTDPRCQEFVFMVQEECWKVGAYTLLEGMAYARERVRHQLMPVDALAKVNHVQNTLFHSLDVTMFIGESDLPNWTEGIPEKYKAAGPVRQRLREILDDRKVRWIYFGWPLPQAAKAYGVAPAKFRRIFFDSIRESFGDRMLKLCRYYEKALSGKDRVIVKADDGSNLTLSIKGRPVVVDDAFISPDDMAKGDFGLNIPSGEAFVAPLETSANGKVVFEDVSTQTFGSVRNLTVEFTNGKVTRFTADQGVENFQKFLEANTGEKDRIAELGIGTNPGAEYTGGSIIIDEKILGTIHIAIGNNTGAYHGVNKASSHLDMIKDMRHGELWVDGELIMDQGRPAAKV